MSPADPTRPFAEKTDRRAWLLAAGWTTVAGAATYGSASIAVDVRSSPGLKAVAVAALLAVTLISLTLASDSAGRGLAGRGGRGDMVLFWLTSATVTLTIVVVLGSIVMTVAPDTPGVGSLAAGLGIDVGLGLMGGALGGLLILGNAAMFGGLIRAIQSDIFKLEGADRWKAPPRGDRGARVGRTVLRAAVAGVCGVVASAIALGVVTTVTANHNGAVDAPAIRTDSVLLVVVLPVVAFFLGAVVARWLIHRPRPHPPHHRLRHGTHAAGLTVALFVLAGYLNAGGVERSAARALWSGAATRHVPAVHLAAADADSASPALAQAFAPRLRFAAGEHWFPTTVGWYVAQNPKPTTDAPFCDTVRAGQAGPDGCYGLACDDVVGACAPSGRDDPALYYRYVPSSDRSVRDSDVPAGLRGKSWTLIQYWLFYNYDALLTRVIDQWHQGDWEQVSVLVTRSGDTFRPFEVAYSEHCDGVRLPAARVHWVDTSHPVDYIADGSHANYPRAVDVPVRQLRCSLGLTPRYLGVGGLFFSPAVDGSRLEIPFDYIAGLTDHTETASGPTPRLVPLSTARDVLGFAGRWGRDDRLSAFGHGQRAVAGGPPAPHTQGPWRHPGPSMLCRVTWLGPPPSDRHPADRAIRC